MRLDNQRLPAPPFAVLGWAGVGSCGVLALVEYLSAIVLAIDVAVVFASVICRYFLQQPLDWAEEVARAMMVTQVFLGAAGIVGRGGHAGIDAARGLFPARWRPYLVQFSAWIIAAVAAAIFASAVDLSDRDRRTDDAIRPAGMDFHLSGNGRRTRHDDSWRRRRSGGSTAHGLDHARRRRGSRAGGLRMECRDARGRVVALRAAERRLPRQPRHRRPDRLRARAVGARLFSCRPQPADVDLFPAIDGGQRSFRAAGRAVLRSGRPRDGSERHVGAADRTPAAHDGTAARRVESHHHRRHGFFLRHFGLEARRYRGGRRHHHAGRAQDRSGPQRGRRPAGEFGDHGRDNSPLRQHDHFRLRRQCLDRRPFHRRHCPGCGARRRACGAGGGVRQAHRPEPRFRHADAAAAPDRRRACRVGDGRADRARSDVGRRHLDRDFRFRRRLRTRHRRLGVSAN